MHFCTSSELNDPFILSSANSMLFSSFHKLHACREKMVINRFQKFIDKYNWYSLDEVGCHLHGLEGFGCLNRNMLLCFSYH